MNNASKMTEIRKNFNETKYMSFLQKMTNCQKNIMKSGINSAAVLKEALIVNQCTMKNIQKLK